jgi:hypothetical protein
MSSSKRAYGWKCSKSTRSRRIRKQSSTSMAQGPLCASFERLWSACRGAVGRAERQRLGRLCRSLAGLGEYRHLEDELGPCGPGGDLDATAQAWPRSATRVRKSFATSRAVFALEVARWRSASCPHVGQFSRLGRTSKNPRSTSSRILLGIARAVQRSGKPVARFTWMVRAPVRRSFTLTRKFA